MTRYTNAGSPSTAKTGAENENSADTLEVLNDLLDNARDGEYGFRACAEEVDSTELRALFEERASDCAAATTELGELIRRYGGEAERGGTIAGAMHRGWVHVKVTLGADSANSMLEECERGEDAAIARYRKALKADLPPDVRAIVDRQAAGAQRNHDRIRVLRDSTR
ncbi:MAG: PA2169 family four-helix-bundle protein [Variovorax sp.]|nr:MAG: PA2169 family four-helix-bundle protein [Variovorax sp.]